MMVFLACTGRARASCGRRAVSTASFPAARQVVDAGLRRQDAGGASRHDVLGGGQRDGLGGA
jgi:hypothetical protein